MDAIDAAARSQDWPGVVAACRQALAHPCAAHAFYVADVWTGLAEALANEGRYDEAIHALQSAVAHGHQASPHPDADIARLHLLAGRRPEADALFASVRERTPDDLLAYLAAGLGYADAGDHEAAVAWCGTGMERALAGADPAGVVPGLQEARNASLSQLGRGPDALTARADEFIRRWARPAPGTWEPPAWPDDATPPPAPAPCEHCGWVPPGAGDPGDEEPADVRRRLPGSNATPIGVAWFTADEWPRAVARWPHLLDEMPQDHLAYVREVQGRVLEMAEATGFRVVMVPISLGGLVAHCGDDGTLDPGSGRARMEYAAALLRQGHGRSWPPERNEACWCGSGRKYKVCCGTVEAPVS